MDLPRDYSFARRLVPPVTPVWKEEYQNCYANAVFLILYRMHYYRCMLPSDNEWSQILTRMENHSGTSEYVDFTLDQKKYVSPSEWGKKNDPDTILLHIKPNDIISIRYKEQRYPPYENVEEIRGDVIPYEDYRREYKEDFSWTTYAEQFNYLYWFHTILSDDIMPTIEESLRKSITRITVVKTENGYYLTRKLDIIWPKYLLLKLEILSKGKVVTLEIMRDIFPTRSPSGQTVGEDIWDSMRDPPNENVETFDVKVGNHVQKKYFPNLDDDGIMTITQHMSTLVDNPFKGYPDGEFSIDGVKYFLAGAIVYSPNHYEAYIDDELVYDINNPEDLNWVYYLLYEQRSPEGDPTP